MKRSLVILSVAGCLTAPAAVTVRVKTSAAGVPQIHVDGRPVRPRMFWGWHGHRPIIAGTEWKSFAFEVTPKSGDPGTLHLRIPSGRDVELLFRNVRIVDAETGADYLDPASLASPESFAKAWTIFDNDTAGHAELKDGCLRMTGWAKVRGPKRPPHFHCYTKRTPFVSGHTYRVSFEAKASKPDMPITPAVYTCRNGVYTRWPFKGDDPFPHEVKLAAEAGVDFVSFMAPKTIWTDDESYDWGELDDYCDEILSVNPKALLIPRIKLETGGWWARKYPDEVIMFADGQKGPAPSIASRHYRALACRFLTAMVRHLCEKYPDNFAGIHPAAQNSSEFFYWDTWRNPYCGYDPATQAAFDAWRRRHGRAPVPVPPLAARKLDIFTSPTLADPVKDRALVDFRLYQQEEMADFVAEVAAACRKASGGTKLVLIFYGYQWEFAGHSRGAGASGHYGVTHLLDRAAGDIDILCSPISYFDRAWGGTAPAMNAAETVMRRGVMWLFEDDARTFLEPNKAAHAHEGVCKDLLQTQQVLQRNTAQEIVRGFDGPARARLVRRRPAVGGDDAPGTVRPRDAQARPSVRARGGGHRGRGVDDVPLARTACGTVRVARARRARPRRRAVRTVSAGGRPCASDSGEAPVLPERVVHDAREARGHRGAARGGAGRHARVVLGAGIPDAGGQEPGRHRAAHGLHGACDAADHGRGAGDRGGTAARAAGDDLAGRVSSVRGSLRRGGDGIRDVGAL